MKNSYNLTILRNEEAKTLKNYLVAKAEAAAAAAKEKAAKAACKDLFAKLQLQLRTNGITDYVLCAVQSKGEAAGIVYKETTAKGTVDYAKALEAANAVLVANGIEAINPEDFRKAATVRTSVEWASEKQLAKIAELSEA